MRLSRDPLTRWWWRIVGRPVDLDGEHAWLDAPTSRTSHVDDQAWIADWAERIGGTAVRGGSDAGLIPAMEALDGPGLDVSRLAAPVRDFYEHTSRWHMDVWAEWSPLFWPAGELVSRLFAKRIQQLALPMRALDVAHGMDSSVTVIRDASGAQASAGWIRRLRSTGDPVFSGAYRTNRLPSSDRASVHVTFPLESGNLQVYLRPRIDGDAHCGWTRPLAASVRTAPTSSCVSAGVTSRRGCRCTSRSTSISTVRGCCGPTTC